jgi:hypothetical protein
MMTLTVMIDFMLAVYKIHSRQLLVFWVYLMIRTSGGYTTSTALHLSTDIYTTEELMMWRSKLQSFLLFKLSVSLQQLRC